MAVDRERRRVRHGRFEAKPAEPPVGEIEPDLVAQSPLGTDRIAIADQQHPDHQLRIYRGAADLAVKRLELLTHQAEVEQRIQLAQQMVRWNLVLEPEMVEQPLLTSLQPTHHRQTPSRSIPPRQNHGLYLSVATFAPRGESGGGREPEIGWGERARNTRFSTASAANGLMSATRLPFLSAHAKCRPAHWPASRFALRHQLSKFRVRPRLLCARRFSSPPTDRSPAPPRVWHRPGARQPVRRFWSAGHARPC